MNNFDELRAALAAGPTEGNWYVGRDIGDQSRHVYSDALVNDGAEEWAPNICCTDDGETYIDFEANARYIAAASPTTVRALLAALDAARVDARRYKWVLENGGSAECEKAEGGR